jgi:hypothetical protein
MTAVQFCSWKLPVALIGLAMLCPPARAADAEGTVVGTGQAIISRPAQIIRMTATLTADAKDITSALAKLKSLQDEDRRKLADLGATAESVEFGSAQLPGGGDARQQYIQRMTRMNGRNAAKPAPKEPSVTVSCTLKAEWPIKSTDDSMLAESYALQQKVKAANLTGGKDAKAATPEEQEVLEEAQAVAEQNGQDTASGEPAFVYVIRVSADDQAAATADAFKKARAAAARLAQAADAQLGALRQLSSAASVPGEGTDDSYTAAIMMQREMGIAAPAAVKNDGEAISPSPGIVKFQIDVTATFAIK